MVSVTFGDALQEMSGEDDELAEFLAARPGDPPRMDPNPAAARFRAEAGLDDPEDEDELIDLEGIQEDPEPFEKPNARTRFLGKGSGRRPAAPTKPGRRPSIAVQKDVRAKTAMLLSLPATVWATKDPYCGEVAKAAVPEVSEALADIFCDSPEIVAWFTTSGQFTKYLKLAVALKELAVTFVQHHVTHSIGDDAEEQAPSDWNQYVAG